MTDGIFSNYNGSSVFTEINTKVKKRNGTLKLESHVRESQRERWESVSMCLCISVYIMTCPVVSNSKVNYCLFGVNYLTSMNENGKVKKKKILAHLIIQWGFPFPQALIIV